MVLATSKRPRKVEPVKDDVGQDESVDSLKDVVAYYESVFEHIGRINDQIVEQESEITNAKIDVELAKKAYDDAKANLKDLESIRDGSKSSLFRFVAPLKPKAYPLFDRMDKTDEAVHGHNAVQWREEPIAALRLSPNAVQSLLDADVILIGQLQDRILADAFSWWQSIAGLTEAVAAAIVDKLNDFVYGGASK